MLKWIFLLISAGLFCAAASGQEVDPKYILEFPEPNVATFSIERTGAGIEISPDNTLVPPTASFPFNTGTNLGIHLSYKFINLSVSQSIGSKTNNKSLVVSTNIYNGMHNFGGKIGFYKNIASIKDKKNIDIHSAINLFQFSPYWLINLNHQRFSLPAISDYSERQRRSAGAFMFEVNPYLLRAKGNNGLIIPDDGMYEPLFENQVGLEKLTIINLDLRPGYVYTKIFKEGTYFISGGLFIGPGSGYHHAKAAAATESGMHWQSSVRMLASAGYNGDRYFVVSSFRYTNSFTPLSSIGVLADEGSVVLTFGMRFNAIEKELPETWQELLYKRKRH